MAYVSIFGCGPLWTQLGQNFENTLYKIGSTEKLTKYLIIVHKSVSFYSSDPQQALLFRSRMNLSDNIQPRYLLGEVPTWLSDG